jgi:hypothetical protein
MKGESLNVVYTDGMTPLMRAVRAGSLETVCALLHDGACVNFQARGQYAIRYVHDLEPETRYLITRQLFRSGFQPATITSDASADLIYQALWFIMYTHPVTNEHFFRLADLVDCTALFDDAPWTPFEQACRFLTHREYQTQTYIDRFVYLLPDHVTLKWRGGTALHLLTRLYPWSPDQRTFLVPLLRLLLTRCTLADVRMRDVHGRVVYDQFVQQNDVEVLCWMREVPRRLISLRQRRREQRYRRALQREWWRCRRNTIFDTNPDHGWDESSHYAIYD